MNEDHIQPKEEHRHAALSEEQAEQVSGAGYHGPIHACPKCGKTGPIAEIFGHIDECDGPGPAPWRTEG